MAKNRVGAGVILAAVLTTALAGPAAAQTVSYLRFGNATYSSDPFCEDPTAALTMIMLGVSTPLFGVSAELNNGDWPWPALASPVGLTHGRAFQIMGELTPTQLIAPGINRYLRPFIGIGLHHSSDGDPRVGSGGAEVFGVKGQTRPFVAFGANAFVPIGSSRFGVTGGYRWTSVFFGDFELASTGGASQTEPGETLTAGSWTLGFTLQLGNSN